MNIHTSLGLFGVEFTQNGITRIHFRPEPVSVTSVPEFVRQLARALRDYATGIAVRFDVPLDLPGTPFQRAVWRALQAIPAGETRSYAWVAKRVGRPRAVRAVGAACGANPVPILVPCHRVVKADMSLGGFSAGLGWKRKLLRLESRCRPAPESRDGLYEEQRLREDRQVLRPTRRRPVTVSAVLSRQTAKPSTVGRVWDDRTPLLCPPA